MAAAPMAEPPLSRVFPGGAPLPSALTQKIAGQRQLQVPEEVEYLPPLRVAPPRPRIPGGTEFYGAVPKHSATFAWSELCATPSPEDSLAPVPQIPMKTWYNSYIYVPEEGQQDRQYLQRFTRGPNGEWIDVVKARRLVDAMEERRQQQMREYMERDMVLAGMRALGSGALSAGMGAMQMGMSGIGAGWGAIDAGFSALEGTPGSRSVGRAGMQAGDGSDIGHGVHQTLYTDAYSGERLIACKGKLQTRAEIFDEYHIRGQAVPEDEPFFDFDNLRFSWPFARPEKNKPVSQHTYDWFDRRNMYIQGDSSCEIVEMPSVYIDSEELHRWWHAEPQRRATPTPMPQPSVQQLTNYKN